MSGASFVLLVAVLMISFGEIFWKREERWVWCLFFAVPAFWLLALAASGEILRRGLSRWWTVGVAVAWVFFALAVPVTFKVTEPEIDNTVTEQSLTVLAPESAGCPSISASPGVSPQAIGTTVAVAWSDGITITGYPLDPPDGELNRAGSNQLPYMIFQVAALDSRIYALTATTVPHADAAGTVSGVDFTTLPRGEVVLEKALLPLPQQFLVTSDIVFVPRWVTTTRGYTPVLVAIDATSGKTLWSRTAGRAIGGTWYWPDVLTAWSSGNVLLVNGAHLLALDPATGSTKWTVDPLAGQIHALTATEDLVALGGLGVLTGINPIDGSPIWCTETTEEGTITDIVITDRRVIARELLDGESTSSLHSFDQVTGEEQWVSDLPWNTDTLIAGPDYILVSTPSGVSAVATSDGRTMWEFEGYVSRPIIVNGSIYLAVQPDPDQPSVHLLQLDPGTGATMQDQELVGLSGRPRFIQPIPGGWVVPEKFTLYVYRSADATIAKPTENPTSRVSAQ